MGGLDTKRLVLVRNTCKNSAGEETYYHGTGYFITKELVLTAAHVLLPPPAELKVRLETPLDGKPGWRMAETEPVWSDQKLDAALIRIVEPIHDVSLPPWGAAPLEQGVEWHSVAYPRAAVEMTDDGNAWKSAGLKGFLYAQGGGGQGPAQFELGVEHESKEQWNGISGAPIFVGDDLMGIVKSYKPGFEGKRLDGAPLSQLLNDPAFQRALKPKWLPPLPQKLWTLILISENNDEEFSDRVRSAVEGQLETINKAAGLPSGAEPRFVEVRVTEVLTEPARWYEAVEAICAAPIMVVDVTDYQPAIMLFLGIRAVTRRGVTITVTSAELDESLLSKLPFNIQETKLIYRWRDLDVVDPRHPIRRIGEAIVKGLKQIRGNQGYLDLPAYEAVRCPKPQPVSTDSNGQDGGAEAAGGQEPGRQNSEPERILMLCSFNSGYRKNWLYVSEKITLTFKGVGKSLERMLDISSPRLVGLALYESIRWTPCCIVDWTHWRPNVFFELGVRLACSDIGPVSLIDEEDRQPALATDAELAQKGQLLKLLQPISYKRGGAIAPFREAFARYHSFLNDSQENPAADLIIPHNATHRTVANAYDWTQEAFARPPHEELRATVEALQSKDPQKDGFQALFAANAEFKLEIQRSGRERWIAAWYYIKNRYEWEEIKRNEEVRMQLSALTESVMQQLVNQPDPNYRRIYQQAVELSEQLDAL